MSRESSVVMRDGGAECRLGGGSARADLLVSRRGSAAPPTLDRNDPLELEILECPVEGAAVRLVAERAADVVAVEHVGETRDGRLHVVVELTGGPPWGLRRRRSGGRP